MEQEKSSKLDARSEEATNKVETTSECQEEVSDASDDAKEDHGHLSDNEGFQQDDCSADEVIREDYNDSVVIIEEELCDLLNASCLDEKNKTETDLDESVVIVETTKNTNPKVSVLDNKLLKLLGNRKNITVTVKKGNINEEEENEIITLEEDLSILNIEEDEDCLGEVYSSDFEQEFVFEMAEKGKEKLETLESSWEKIRESVWEQEFLDDEGTVSHSESEKIVAR